MSSAPVAASILASMTLAGIAGATTDIPLEGVGSTGAVGVLIWLAVTARGAHTDYRAEKTARITARAAREAREIAAAAAAEQHRLGEREHWGRVELALDKLPRVRD